MSDKVVGYVLLVLGLLVIVYSVVSGINVFFGKTQPFPIFNLDPIIIDYAKLADTPVPQGADLKQEVAGSDLLNQPLNLMAHLFFIGFLTTVGAKVAGIGTTLIRPIVVKAKTEG